MTDPVGFSAASISPEAESSGCDRVNFAERCTASSVARACSSIGAAAKRSGEGPGRRSPAADAVSPTAPLSPSISAASWPMEVPAALSCSISRCPVADGVANPPWRWASSFADCQLRSGRGAICGEVAPISRSRVFPVRSILPWPSASSGPADTENLATSALRGPSSEAETVSGPSSGSPAKPATSPCAGSVMAICPVRRSGVIVPLSL